MRRIRWGFVAVVAAVGLMAATTGSRRAAYETIIVHQGDTLKTFFSIDSGSALDPGHQYTVAARCGVGHVYLRLMLNGQRVTNDTVLVNVTGCPPAPDVVPVSLSLYRDSGTTVIPFVNGDAGPIGETFCIYAVARNKVGLAVTGRPFSLQSSDPTIQSVDQPACPDTTINPAWLTVRTAAPAPAPMLRSAE